MIHLKDTAKERGIRCNRWTKKLSFNAVVTEDVTKVDCKGCLGQRAAPRFPAKERQLSLGDILSSSWGYDQTNVNFYQVTRLVGKTMVELREVASRVESREIGSDYVVAVRDGFLVPRGEYDKRGLPFTRRASGTGVNVESYERASLWDGKPEYKTASGYGH